MRLGLSLFLVTIEEAAFSATLPHQDVVKLTMGPWAATVSNCETKQAFFLLIISDGTQRHETAGSIADEIKVIRTSCSLPRRLQG